jgi:hypothetical protein
MVGISVGVVAYHMFVTGTAAVPSQFQKFVSEGLVVLCYCTTLRRLLPPPLPRLR